MRPMFLVHRRLLSGLAARSTVHHRHISNKEAVRLLLLGDVHVIQARHAGGHTPGPLPPIPSHNDLTVPRENFKEGYSRHHRRMNKWLLLTLPAAVLATLWMSTTDYFELHKGGYPDSYTKGVKEANERAAGEKKKTGEKGVPITKGSIKEKAASGGGGGWSLFGGGKEKKATPKHVELPEHVQYLLIGTGTASVSAMRAIRARDPESKVLMLGEESDYPYMRPPLSKELWFTDDPQVAKTLEFKPWEGKSRSVFFEPEEFYLAPDKLKDVEHGGVAIARGLKVTKVDSRKHEATLSDGRTIKYDKCLVATGGRPKNIPAVEKADAAVRDRVTLFRGVPDFQELHAVARRAKDIVIVGGGFLGSELAVALGNKKQATITQLYPEEGNMGRVLPKYLSEWTTRKVEKCGVKVLPKVSVTGASMAGKKVALQLSNGQTVQADHVVVAVGLEPNVELAETSGLEVDEKIGGFKADAELHARTDVWVAGDCVSFYDVRLGRRRVEHHDHAVVSGRLAGDNMTGAGKPYGHQSMFWSDLGPEVGYEAIGVVDSSLKTYGVFARGSKEDTPQAKAGEGVRSETEAAAPEKQPKSGGGETFAAPDKSDDYGKGVVFYLRGRQVVGIVMWNLFNRMPIARKIINEGKQYDDFADLGKLFNIHGTSEAEAVAES